MVLHRTTGSRPLDVDRLESLGYNVIARTDMGLAVAMPRDYIQGPGHLVQVMENNLESGAWAFRAIFARFSVQVQGWPLQHLVIGSAHLNNDVARDKRGITRNLLQQLFQTAKDTCCDILGADFNQGGRSVDGKIPFVDPKAEFGAGADIFVRAS